MYVAVYVCLYLCLYVHENNFIFLRVDGNVILNKRECVYVNKHIKNYILFYVCVCFYPCVFVYLQCISLSGF